MGLPRTTVVTTKNGKIRGIQRKSEYSKKTYYSFLGIPYAKPPTDDRRFKPPEPMRNWLGILDATSEKDDCIQFSCYVYKFVGSEDCLHLNVHVPQEPSKITQPKAVIVMIHGGALLWGSGATDVNGSPEYVMHQDVIYVTINYRLHVLGFLNLNLPECPGNVGLKDIVLALQWIQENIINFGGNPQNVTLIGYSCGAIIIHALMLSSATRGLFHKVIMMGMYMFHPFIVFEENPLDLAFKFGKRLGFSGSDRGQLLKFLKKQSLQSLILELKEQTDLAETEHKKINPSSPFALSIEEIEDGAFMSKSPIELMKSIRPVPIIFGFCQNENAFALIYKYKQFLENDFSTIYRQNIYSWLHGLDDSTIKTVERKVNLWYTRYTQQLLDENNNGLKHEVMQPQQDITVLDFYHTIADIIFSISPSTPVYVYEFQYKGDLNWMSNRLKPLFQSYIEGTVHSDDAHYWMCKNVKPNASDSSIVEIITKLFTNFAKIGNPNDDGIDVDWKPTSPRNAYYLRIGEKLRLSKGRPGDVKLSFWEKLKRSYDRKKYRSKSTQ